MIQRYLKRAAAVVLIGISFGLSAEPAPSLARGLFANLSAAQPGIKFPRVKRQVFVPTADGKRDRFQHLLYVAESGTTAAKRGKGYRYLGSILDRVGRHAEALRAYEAGALQGDGPSSTIVIKAQADNRYRPLDLPALVALVYVPRARADGTSGPMLLAKLISSGQVKGQGTSGEWLRLAASRGSSEAVGMLAEAAERGGKIKEASRLYASIDRGSSKLERALHQARVYYLGDKGKPDTKLGLAWLQYAGGLDQAAAGTLAATLYRKEVGSGKNRAALLEVAIAGGANPQQSGHDGFATRLRTASNDADRLAILGEVQAAADAGDAGAAWIYADAVLSAANPVDPNAGYHYLGVAVAGGNESAASEATKRLTALQADAPEAKNLLASMTSAADGGMVSAMLALADVYAWGGPVQADAALSLKYMRSAADAGSVDAQLRLGLHLASDTSDPANLELARHYLAAASKQGSAPAEAYLAGLKPST